MRAVMTSWHALTRICRKTAVIWKNCKLFRKLQIFWCNFCDRKIKSPGETDVIKTSRDFLFIYFRRDEVVSEVTDLVLFDMTNRHVYVHCVFIIHHSSNPWHGSVEQSLFLIQSSLLQLLRERTRVRKKADVGHWEVSYSCKSTFVYIRVLSQASSVLRNKKLNLHFESNALKAESLHCRMFG